MNPLTPPITTPRGRLGAYVVLSLLVHAAVVIVWPTLKPPTISPTILTVNLQAPLTPSAPVSSTVSSRHHQPLTTPTEAPPQPVAALAMVATLPPGNLATALPTPPATPATSTGSAMIITEPKAPAGIVNESVTLPLELEEVSLRVRERLNHDLQRQFSYPRLAVQRGWEGEVVLAMRLTASGRIEQVRLAHSSGYAVLDESAIDTLRRVGAVTEAVEWLAGRNLELTLPVLYRLQQG